MSEFSMWPPPGFVRSDFVRQYQGDAHSNSTAVLLGSFCFRLPAPPGLPIKVAPIRGRLSVWGRSLLNKRYHRAISKE